MTACLCRRTDDPGSKQTSFSGAAPAEMPTAPIDWSQMLERQLPLIAELTRVVAVRHRLPREEGEDFAAVVRLRLVERDFAVLKSFRGASSLRTFLAVVIARLCLDYLTKQWGKWRPSAEARRLGPTAISLERMLRRDGRPFDEAVGQLRARDSTLTREELVAMRDVFPPRMKRLTVDERCLEVVAADGPSPEDRLLQTDAGRRAKALAEALAALDPEDRQLVRLRFFDDLTVSEISRRHGLDQGQLYRRLGRLLPRLRQNLQARGIVSSASVSAGMAMKE